MKVGDLIWVRGRVRSVSPEKIKVWIRGIDGEDLVLVRPEEVMEEPPLAQPTPDA